MIRCNLPRSMKALIAAIVFCWIPPTAHAAPVRLVDEAPVKIEKLPGGVVWVDFGRVAFGNVRLLPPPGVKGEVTVHFGEASAKGRIDRKPPGSVRYAVAKVSLTGSGPVIAAPPADKRNTQQPAAVLTPPEWGVVLPFRWLEIEGWNGDFRPEHVRRRAAFAATWDDQAASFKSSDPMLDRIWELCRYSIKATTFAGVYVDGDRERIPYEADAYLNQLGQYATDRDILMARDTFDRLMKHPTWPTEWAAHMIFMAHADWMQTGDTTWLAARYESLKPKLLLERAREDGLLVSNAAQVKRDDIVDWPVAERDGFVFKPVNTVVNAFHLRALTLMAEMASALGKESDAAEYRTRETKAREAFLRILFDEAGGKFRDGEGTDHASLHASLFPLAFGLVPEARRGRVADWAGGRGMACSVYAAQYLLEALFENEAGARALGLITADGDRSWKHMVESGTTITWEAWDQKYKPNQDWNHAWGAAPANLLPRYVLGVKAVGPGWKRALIRPNAGNLKSAEGRIPTPRGPVLVKWKNAGAFGISVKLPDGVAAKVELPATASSRGVFNGGRQVKARREGSRWVLEEDVSGTVSLDVR